MKTGPWSADPIWRRERRLRLLWRRQAGGEEGWHPVLRAQRVRPTRAETGKAGATTTHIRGCADLGRPGDAGAAVIRRAGRR